MKSTILQRIKSISSKVKLLIIGLFVLVLPLVGAAQASTDLMEGSVTSLNVTSGETEYKPTTDAQVDDVVQVQLWQHNRNNPEGEKVNNTVVKFDVPTQQGKTQVITGTSTSDNGNTIEGKTTVNLSLERAKLDYIEGSAKYRYNKGAADGNPACMTGFDFPPESCYATVSISDSVVAGGVNLDTVRGGPLTGCNAYHETVIIQVRVKADVVSVNKFVRHEGGETEDWKTDITVNPGDRIEYMIRFKNEGNTVLDDVMVGDNLPKYNAYVDGTTMLSNSNHPSGTSVNNDNVTKGGINVGDYNPGAIGLVWFTVQIDGKEAYEKCGVYDVRNVGIVQPKGMIEYYNTAQVNIDVQCDDQPVYKCDLLTLEQLGDRKIRATVTPELSGNVSVRNYTYDFGDGSEPLMTDKNSVEYIYSQDGNYNVVAKISFIVDGEDKDNITSPECEASVTFESGQPVIPVTPTVLPNTGVGSLAGIFTAVSAAGAVAHRMVTSRRSS